MKKDIFKITVKTFHGLEKVLAKELEEIGARNIEIIRRAVNCEGDDKILYKINFYARTALKVLKPIHEFHAKNEVELYDGIYHYDWGSFIDPKDTIAIDTVVLSGFFKHSKFVAYKVKDAIVDQIRKQTGKRPSVLVSAPTYRINVHISNDQCTISLDSSGDSLHRRGYRFDGGAAPLNEVLAAGMVMLTGWNGKSHFIDPMTGSGTIAIEAALYANKIPPGLFRSSFGFEKWHSFDPDLYEEIVNEDYENASAGQVTGLDISPDAIKVALQNVKNASLSKKIELKIMPFQKYSPPEGPGIVVMNPPYGQRIKQNNITEFYKMIGDVLKNAFNGYEVWMLSPKDELTGNIGLHPMKKITLFNGALECKYQKYQIYEGSLKNNPGAQEARKSGKGLVKK
jgi:putative N6-adenine-specific DNA methylase